MNRVMTAVANTEQLLGQMSKDGLEKMEVAGTFDFNMYIVLQEKKSLAVANQSLTLEEGNTIYGYMGNSLTTLNKQPLAVRIALMTLLRHLMKRAA